MRHPVRVALRDGANQVPLLKSSSVQSVFSLGCYNGLMETGSRTRHFHLSNYLLTAAAVACLLTSGTASAHQLFDLNGGTVQHNHVYKRNSYGQNYAVGHIAPTPHGNDMIIWSPAPANDFGSSRNQMRIEKPRRPSKPTRKAGITRNIAPPHQIQSRQNQDR